MTITAQMVQELREKSGAGLMDCKRALESCGGDVEKAIQNLREKGKASAAQKAGRSTRQGLVCAWVSPDAKRGGMVEVNCETDFVARTQDFQQFALALARGAGEKAVRDLPRLLAENVGGEPVEAALKEKIGKLGENIQIKKLAALGGNGGASVIGRYVHAPSQQTPECGSLGVLLELQAPADSSEVRELARELCMQVAAANPRWVGKDDVPADTVAKEKEIYKEQCRQSGKPEQAWEKIISGKLADFFRQFCLIEQPHVRDASGKTPVRTLIEAAAKNLNGAVAVRNFARFKMGEE